MKIISREEIADAYAELLKYQKQGKFAVCKYCDIPDETKNKMIKEIVEVAKTLPKSKIEDKNNSWKVFLK